MKKPKTEKLIVSKETNAANEKIILTKRTDTEDITKTLEKISNGYLLTTEVWNFKEDMKSKVVKKYFEKNPLEKEDEDEEDEKGEENSEFMENWNILEIK